MANSSNSVITGKFRGSPGTPAQVQTQERSLLASRYGRAVMKDQDQGIRDAYTSASRPRQNQYSRADGRFYIVSSGW